MKLIIHRKFENSPVEMDVEIEEKDDKEALKKALFFMENDFCPLCLSNNIAWQANEVKTDKGNFIYIKRRCRKCGAVSTAGEYKNGGFFWKKWEKYTPKPESTEELSSEEYPF